MLLYDQICNDNYIHYNTFFCNASITKPTSAQYFRNKWLLVSICFCVCVRLEFVKSPEVTLCGWRGYKPSINTLLCSFSLDFFYRTFQGFCWFLSFLSIYIYGCLFTTTQLQKLACIHLQTGFGNESIKIKMFARFFFFRRWLWQNTNSIWVNCLFCLEARTSRQLRG